MNVGAPRIYLRWKANIVGSRLGWTRVGPQPSRMNVGRLICFALETDCVDRLVHTRSASTEP
jgi:hypothetical protein